MNTKLKVKLQKDVTEYIKVVGEKPTTCDSIWGMYYQIVFDRVGDVDRRNRILEYDGTKFALYISESDDTIFQELVSILKSL